MFHVFYGVVVGSLGNVFECFFWCVWFLESLFHVCVCVVGGVLSGLCLWGG